MSVYQILVPHPSPSISSQFFSFKGAEPPPTHILGQGLYLRNHQSYCNKANTILKAFARVVNKPNLSVLSTKAAKPQM